MQALAGPCWGRPSHCCLGVSCWEVDLRHWCVCAAGIVLELFCALNPVLKRRQLNTFHWAKLWAGFYLNNAGRRRAGWWDGRAGSLLDVQMARLATLTAAPHS